MALETLSPSRRVAAEVVYAALQALKQHGGELATREVLNEVERHVTLDDWAKERYEKTGYVR